MRGWPLLVCLFLGTAAHADPCPISDQSKLWGKFRHLSHIMVAVTYRKECGVAGAQDLAAIQSLHEGVGCSSETELGRYFAYRVEAPLKDGTGHPGVQMLRSSAPLAYNQFCRMAEFLPWPEGSAYPLMARPDAVAETDRAAYQAFWAHLDAMQSELTRAMKEAID
ncbi:MAG: hypothetical protein AAFY03_01390 [Pseudomonadota bacterium]